MQTLKKNVVKRNSISPVSNKHNFTSIKMSAVPLYTPEQDEEFVSVGMDDLLESEQSHQNEDCLETKNNSNCNNLTSVKDETDWEPQLDWTKVGVLSAIIVLTVIGNVAVIAAICGRRAKMTRMYYFILHLSLADLLTAFLTLLPELAWTFTYPQFYGGVVTCKFVKFAQMLGPYLSSYVLIMTAVDRYQAICNPLGNCTWTPRRSQIMIGAAWTIALLLCIPQSFIFQGDNCQAHFKPGWGVKAYVTWFSVSNFFVPFVILLFCYSRICFVIWDNVNSKTYSASDEDLSRIERTAKCLKRFLVNCCCGCCNGKQKSVKYRWTSSLKSRNNGQKQEHQEDMATDHVIRDGNDSSDDSSVESSDRHNARRSQEEGMKMSITIEPPSTSSTKEGSGPKLKKQTAFDQNLPPNETHKSSVQSTSTEPTFGGKRIRPRSHSIKGISRAKIKTVKLTVVVILGYIACSAPFICVQLWATYGSPSQAVLASMEFLFWLLTLNSVVNPWIYMMFNANLVESLHHLFCPCCDPMCPMSTAGGQRRSRLANRRSGGGNKLFFGQGREARNGSTSPATRSTFRSTTMTTSVNTTYLTTSQPTTMLRSSRESSPASILNQANSKNGHRRRRSPSPNNSISGDEDVNDTTIVLRDTYAMHQLA